MGVILGLLSYLAFAIALPFLLFHPKLKHGVRERLGGGAPLDLPEGPRIWVHGASAGDVLALMPTVRAVKRLEPDARIILTTITNSGRVMAERQRDLVDAVTYSPYDVPLAVRRAFDRIRPQMLILEYTELWPQLVREAHRRGVTLVLHNGRFSDRRIKSYRRLFALTGNLLAHFALLLMRDEQQADNARRLAAPERALHVTGNTKFDNVQPVPPPQKLDELRAAMALEPDALVWVAGSTHEGEEEILIDVFRRLRKQFPELRLIIAPRYVERGERIVALAQRSGFGARPRSRSGEASEVIVLDTIGELAAAYALATLVFVGGSFVQRGGQNILEPAACGKPTLFGPFMHNFADLVQVLLGRGGIQVASPEQLERVLADLLSRPDHRAELGELARRQAVSIRGAATRNAELIAGLLRSPQRAQAAQ